MSSFAPKVYQAQVLESVEAYFHACHELPSPSIAYTATTERLWGRGLAYNPLAGVPTDMPYFCLRVPTGGGKTWLAAKSVALVNTHLLRCEHSVILWLVPSKPIREQTLRALARYPSRTAFSWPGGSMTYRAATDMIGRMQGVFARIGLAPGTRAGQIGARPRERKS